MYKYLLVVSRVSSRRNKTIWGSLINKCCAPQVLTIDVCYLFHVDELVVFVSSRNDTSRLFSTLF